MQRESEAIIGNFKRVGFIKCVIPLSKFISYRIEKRIIVCTTHTLFVCIIFSLRLSLRISIFRLSVSVPESLESRKCIRAF